LLTHASKGTKHTLVTLRLTTITRPHALIALLLASANFNFLVARVLRVSGQPRAYHGPQQSGALRKRIMIRIRGAIICHN
jgi:hypothetical protein